MSKYLPFKTSTKIQGDYFIKTYTGIPQYYVNRILESSKLLSDLGIGPLVISTNLVENKLTITYEKINPTVKSDFTPQFQKELTDIITLLHQHDYVHGDLCISNIGIKNGRPFLLDHDTMFHISQSHLKCNKDYMYKAFDINNIEDFIQHDYNNWKDELECD